MRVALLIHIKLRKTRGEVFLASCRYHTKQMDSRNFPMPTLSQIATAMREVLTTVADTAGRTTEFVQRQSKLSGATFVQTLAFGWLANPDATLEHLTQTAPPLG